MARIVGVDLPRNKRGYIGLTYIYGVGRSTALTILEKANVDPELKVQEWSDDQIAAIRNTIAEEGFKVEGELRSSVQLNIKRLMDIGCYRGIRHRIGLPVRGQPRLSILAVPEIKTCLRSPYVTAVPRSKVTPYS